MYSTTVRHANFRSRTGSSSIAPYAKGHGPIGDPVEILPTVQEQYEQYKLIIAECAALSDGLPPALREATRRKLAEADRHAGNLREILQNGSRLAFEKIFVQVASYRLPKDRFLTLVEEAREIWRAEGYADFVPEPTKRERRKAHKRAIYNGWRS